MKEKISTKQVAFCGILAAIYAALTIATAAFAYGPIQFRLAEALCILPFFLPFSTWGLFIGCVIANLFSTVSALDIVIGSLATLLGCLMTSRVKNPYLAPLPTIACNTVLVGAMLAWVYMPENLLLGFATMGGQVLIGEAAVLYVLGLPLLLVLRRGNVLGRLQIR